MVGGPGLSAPASIQAVETRGSVDTTTFNYKKNAFVYSKLDEHSRRQQYAIAVKFSWGFLGTGEGNRFASKRYPPPQYTDNWEPFGDQ
jgi:hypothetical protein